MPFVNIANILRPRPNPDKSEEKDARSVYPVILSIVLCSGRLFATPASDAATLAAALASVSTIPSVAVAKASRAPPRAETPSENPVKSLVPTIFCHRPPVEGIASFTSVILVITLNMLSTFSGTVIPLIAVQKL